MRRMPAAQQRSSPPPARHPKAPTAASPPVAALPRGKDSPAPATALAGGRGWLAIAAASQWVMLAGWEMPVGSSRPPSLPQTLRQAGRDGGGGCQIMAWDRPGVLQQAAAACWGARTPGAQQGATLLAPSAHAHLQAGMRGWRPLSLCPTPISSAPLPHPHFPTNRTLTHHSPSGIDRWRACLPPPASQQLTRGCCLALCRLPPPRPRRLPRRRPPPPTGPAAE
jgi:hypothetical protein